ncbi:MAG TPA: hypothetical protein VNE40_00690 [Candidatus Dormibacteraeota bacterium]|nr:hypothetical protein [Candidatus Dormibacteraeota bacterium]
MTSTESLLLIILGITLAIFLVLAIISLSIGLRILVSLKRVVVKAENVVDSVESAAGVFQNASGPLAVFKVLKNMVELSRHKKRRHHDE